MLLNHLLEIQEDFNPDFLTSTQNTDSSQIRLYLRTPRRDEDMTIISPNKKGLMSNPPRNYSLKPKFIAGRRIKI